MRPILPGTHTLDSQASSRPDNLARTSTATTACFITTESNLDNHRQGSRPRFRQQADRRKCSRNSPQPSTPRQRSPPSRADKPAASSSESGESLSMLETELLTLSPQPSTPSMAGLSRIESSLSFVSSSLAEPSMMCASDSLTDNASLPSRVAPQDELDESSVPQLIMPSLTVPRRRPFSDIGRSLGKLKIMVAGQSGIGKTSLIKSLTQCCEHIVHVDPIESSNAVHALEIYASSRPHPWWRSDSELAAPTRRRLSATGDILDRNVCFVESPGHQHVSSGTWRDLHYVESHLASLLSKPMADSDLLALINSGDEPTVDALLYLIPHRGLDREDIEYLRRAEGMTNVIPVLARADELAAEEIKHIKQSITTRLADEGIDCFSFAGPEPSDKVSSVYAVSTKSRPDDDDMDASTLMNSNYLAPLVPTDLNILVDDIFCLDGSARLRHCAAVKTIKWRREHGDGLLQTALSSGCLVPRAIPERALRLRSARRTRSWDRLELYNWANNLRQSLQSERLYHVLEERSASGPIAYDSCLVRVGKHQDQPAPKQGSKKEKRLHHQDPLGLLELGCQLRRKGMIALEMMSSLGLIGFVMARLVHPEWAGGVCSGLLGTPRHIGTDFTQLAAVISW